MIKPILKIEFPQDVSVEDIEEINSRLNGTDVAKEYHILIVKGNGELINIEIITASDISIHKP